MAQRIEFTKEMKKEYTILLPNMLPIHFEMLQNLFIEYGYNTVLLKNETKEIIDTGLKYVHNDTCYPALLIIGQFISALQSGKYDIKKTALMITQTGGGCRASNYIHLLRKALKKAGFEHVPVISLNFAGLEKNSGFHVTLPMLRKAFSVLAYGDLLMLLSNQTKPYELSEGQSERTIKSWIRKLNKLFSQGKAYSFKEIKKYLFEISYDFAQIPIKQIEKIKVGIVGEIYVKYSSLANNNLEKFLQEQNCEVMVPGILGFILFILDHRITDAELYGERKSLVGITKKFIKYVSKIEQQIIDAALYEGFDAPSPFAHTKNLVTGIIGHGCKMGEGWLLTAEMIELMQNGYENIICTQPFGCLPNHIVGKGMIRKVSKLNPNSNIVPIDYDPGATKVNQENRIKLMLAVANENQITKI